MKKILYIICCLSLGFSSSMNGHDSEKEAILKETKLELNSNLATKINYLGAVKRGKNVAGLFNVFSNNGTFLGNDEPANTASETDFGDVEIGQSVEFFFEFENDIGAAENLSVFLIELLDGDPNFSFGTFPDFGGGTIGLGSIDLAAGEFDVFSVIFEPTETGALNETIRIENSDDFFPDGFFINVKGVGINPCDGVTIIPTAFADLCPGGTLLLSEESDEAADFYEWTGPDGFISNERDPAIFDATTANNGTYTLYLEKGNCQLEESIDVTINFLATPSLNLSGTNTLCVGETLTITNSGSGVTGYEWSGPNNFSSTSGTISIPNATTANSGTYQVAAVGANGCGDFAEFEVEVFDIEPITIEPETAPCEGGEINLATSETIENITNLSWSGPNNFSSSLTFPTISNATSANSGTYAVTVTYETGCTTSASMNITVGTSPTIEIESNTPSCVGETLSLSQTGDAGTHLWSGPNNFTSGNISFSIPDLTLANSGTYSLQLTSANGCVATESVNIALSDLPNPSLSSSGPFCEGEETLTLEATGDNSFDYTWSQTNGNNLFTDQTVTINNPTELDAGNYLVSVSDEAGCTSISTINIGFNGKNPNLNISGNANICVESTLSLMETGGEGMNHQWALPGISSLPINGASIELNNLSSQDAGVYTVTANNGNGCTSSESITVVINDLPRVIAAISADEICEGTSVQLQETGGDLVEWNWTGPNNFSSTDQNPTLSNITLNAAGTYTVTGTNANGCSAENSVVVNVQAVFNAGTGTNQQVCAGTTVDLNTLLTGADAGGIFTDVDGAGGLNNGILQTTNLSAGNYSFIYTQTGTSTCITEARIIIAVQELFIAGEDVTITECQGTSINLVDQLTGADAGGIFLEENSSGGLNGNIFNTTNLSSGNYAITYQTGGGLCPTDEATINVNVVTVPETPQFGDVTYCGGGALQIVATEGEAYTWNSGETTQTIGVRPTTTTTYSVTVTNGGECTSTADIIVTAGTITNLAIAGNITICEGESSELTVTGASTYEWTAANGITDITSSNPIVNPVENTTYNVVATNEFGCTATESISITVNDIPVIQTSPTASFCLGTGATISATGGDDYLWTPTIGLDNPNSSTPLANPEMSTVYSVQATGGNGCTATAEVMVNILDLPTITIGENQAICEDASLELTATGGVNYEWTANEDITQITAATQTLSPTTITTYSVNGTDENGCVNTAEVTVSVNPNPIADAGADQNACAGTGVELMASGGSSYEWNNNVTTAINSVTPTETTTYSVIVSDENGCTAIDEVQVNVLALPAIETSGDIALCVGAGENYFSNRRKQLYLATIRRIGRCVKYYPICEPNCHYNLYRTRNR